MAEAATPTKSTRPSRTRTAPATKTTPAKVAAPKAEPAKVEETTVVVEPTTAVAGKEPLKLVLKHLYTARRFEVFGPDAEAEALGIVGKLYFPLGTKVVKVLATE